MDGEAAGKAALDSALHDWIGRRLGVPVWRLLGLSPEAPPTSFTIGIDSLEGTRDRARRAPEFQALKIKVGGAEDLGAWRPCARSRTCRCAWTPTRAGRSRRPAS